MRARSLGRRVSVRLRMVRRGRHGLGHGKGWACTRWRAGLRTVPSQRMGKPMLGCMPEEAKRRLNPRSLEKVGGSGKEAEQGPGKPLPAGESGSALGEGQSQFSERGQAEKGEGKKRRKSGSEAVRSWRCSRG